MILKCQFSITMQRNTRKFTVFVSRISYGFNTLCKRKNLMSKNILQKVQVTQNPSCDKFINLWSFSINEKFWKCAWFRRKSSFSPKSFLTLTLMAHWLFIAEIYKRWWVKSCSLCSLKRRFDASSEVNFWNNDIIEKFHVSIKHKKWQ